MQISNLLARSLELLLPARGDGPLRLVLAAHAAASSLTSGLRDGRVGEGDDAVDAVDVGERGERRDAGDESGGSDGGASRPARASRASPASSSSHAAPHAAPLRGVHDILDVALQTPLLPRELLAEHLVQRSLARRLLAQLLQRRGPVRRAVASRPGGAVGRPDTPSGRRRYARGEQASASHGRCLRYQAARALDVRWFRGLL